MRNTLTGVYVVNNSERQMSLYLERSLKWQLIEYQF
jgi:hypothetical protein